MMLLVTGRACDPAGESDELEGLCKSIERKLTVVYLVR
jgi:hypothetical protein